MNDFAAMTQELLDRASLSGRERREYEGLLQGLHAIRNRPDANPHGMSMGMTAGGAMTLVMMAAMSGVPFKKFRKLVTRGDLRSLAPGADLEESLLAMTQGLAPPDQAAEMQRQLQAQTERRATLACGAGCWFCCASHTNIAVTVAEVEAVWSEIRDRDTGPRLHPNACPALDSDGRCAAYEVRPQPCRSYGSVSVEACRRVLGDEPEDPEEDDPFVHATSAFNPHMVTLVLSHALGSAPTFVDLLTALRDLRSGEPFERAIANASAANGRFNASEEGWRKRWTATEL